jgi:hypothetical protein
MDEAIGAVMEAVEKAGQTSNTQLDGFDMMPILRGEMKSSHTAMFWQRRGDKAARFQIWKCLKSAKGQGLYDLSTDLSEIHDLSKEKPDIAKMMQEKFATWRKEMDATEPRSPFRDY